MHRNAKIGVATCLTLIGCCANVVYLEHLLNTATFRRFVACFCTSFMGFAILVVTSACVAGRCISRSRLSKNAGTLITLIQFIFITCQGFIFTTRFGTKEPVVPLWEYAKVVVLYFLSSIASNAAFSCHISMPLHMVFKSGSLLANLILAVVILKRSYSLSKYISVSMISIGILICTLMSANPQVSDIEEFTYSDRLKWLWGVFLLTAGLLMAARLGIYQEQIATKYGKHPGELLFYSHALSMPGFLFFSGDIFGQLKVFNESELYEIPVLGLSMPILWFYTILNVFTQFVCIRSIYVLVTELSSLSVTLVITLRKFVSLVFSIYYFENPFTAYHWAGTTLVFGGTLLFADVFRNIYIILFGAASTKSVDGNIKVEPGSTDNNEKKKVS